MDEFGDQRFASAALDAGVGVLGTIRCLEKASVDAAVEVASAARDSVDMYIQEIQSLKPAQTKFEDCIIEHPLYQRELKAQMASLAFLEMTTRFSEIRR